MIRLTRLNSQPLIVNSDLVKLLIDRYGFAPDRLPPLAMSSFIRLLRTIHRRAVRATGASISSF